VISAAATPLFYLVKVIFGLADANVAPLAAFSVAGAFFVIASILIAVFFPGSFARSTEKRLRTAAEKYITREVQAGRINVGAHSLLSLCTDGLYIITNVDGGLGGVRFKERKETHISWTAIQSIETTEMHLYFEYYRGIDAWYVFIPIREFPPGANATLSEFVEEANRLWKTVSVAAVTGTIALPERSTAIQADNPR
jgi:hypothetical protein